MLPYTPLHVLLLRPRRTTPPGPDVLVMTSGNLAGRADRHRRRGGPAPAGAARRRVAAARPADPGALRRLGRAGSSPAPSCRSAGPAATRRCRSRCRSTCPPIAGRRRRPEEHLRAGRGPLRLGQPAHRRHGRPAPPSRRSTATERHLEELTGVAPERAGRRPAPRLPVRAPGPARTPAAGRYAPCSTTTPTSPSVMGEHGLGRRRAGHRVRLRRHRLRHRRRGLGRRGAGRRLQVVPAGGPPRLRAAGRRRRQRAAARTGWRWRTCAPPASPGTTDLPRGRGLPGRRARRARPPARDRVRLRADLQHGPALRRGRLAGRRTPHRRLRGRGRDRARRRWPGAAAGRRRRTPSGSAPTRRRPDRRGSRAGRPRGRRTTSAAGVAAEIDRPPASTPRWPRSSPTSRTLPRRETGLDVVALGGGVFQNALLLGRAPSAPWTSGGSPCCGPGCCRPTTAASRSASSCRRLRSS